MIGLFFVKGNGLPRPTAGVVFAEVFFGGESQTVSSSPVGGSSSIIARF